MKKIPRRRIPVRSSSNRISMDQLGNRLRVKGGKCYVVCPHAPLLQEASGQILKDDVNGFSSTSIICFLEETL
jgi:hypothetical protein